MFKHNEYSNTSLRVEFSCSLPINSAIINQVLLFKKMMNAQVGTRESICCIELFLVYLFGTRTAQQYLWNIGKIGKFSEHLSINFNKIFN